MAQFGADDSHWTLHWTVADGPVTAQSCSTATADRFEALTDEHFAVMARFVDIS